MHEKVSQHPGKSWSSSIYLIVFVGRHVSPSLVLGNSNHYSVSIVKGQSMVKHTEGVSLLQGKTLLNLKPTKIVQKHALKGSVIRFSLKRRRKNTCKNYKSIYTMVFFGCIIFIFATVS